MVSDWSETLKESDFAAQATAGEGCIEVSLTGTADLTVRTQLDHFLHVVHGEAQRSYAQKVTVDVRRLEFMNSSCLKCFVWWISTVQEQPGDSQYRIVFVSSPKVYWQRRSLNALACLASEIISVQA
jgi:hypothetical protein